MLTTQLRRGQQYIYCNSTYLPPLCSSCTEVAFVKQINKAQGEVCGISPGLPDPETLWGWGRRTWCKETIEVNLLFIYRAGSSVKKTVQRKHTWQSTVHLDHSGTRMWELIKEVYSCKINTTGTGLAVVDIRGIQIPDEHVLLITAEA